MTVEITDPGLIGLFQQYFYVIRADSAPLRDLVYRTRYQVYCVENQFLDPAENLGGREMDADDDRAAHVLLMHRETGQPAGTARVIFPSRSCHNPLPIERILDSGNCSPFCRFPPQTTGEVSRFAVPKVFRRRRGEQCTSHMGIAGSAELRVMPLIALALLSGVLGICLEKGISHVAAVMEPTFIRLLNRFGLCFQAVGGVVDYHGIRQPCVARLRDLIDQVREKDSLLWPFWDAEISRIGVESRPGLTG